MKTTLPKESEIIRKWYLVDAADKSTGRLAVQIANLLRGKTKTDYTPHIDMGDFVVVVNAEKIKLTGSKDEKKTYEDFTGYPSGRKLKSASVIRERHPERIIQDAVKNMLPKNRLSRTLFTRLKVYAGSEHPHDAQQPQEINLL